MPRKSILECIAIDDTALHYFCKRPARALQDNAKVTYRQPARDPREIIDSLRIAHRIKNVRQLAARAGINQPTLSRYMSRKTAQMELSGFQALCRLFGVTLSELLGEVPLGSSVHASEVQRLLTQMDAAQQRQLARIARAMLPDDEGPTTPDSQDPA